MLKKILHTMYKSSVQALIFQARNKKMFNSSLLRNCIDFFLAEPQEL